MKKLINAFNSSTGFSGTGSVVVHLENQHKDFIAGVGYTKSLIFKFPAGSQNNYIQKTLSPAVDVTGYDEIVVSIFSTKKSGYWFKKSSNFVYKIDFGTGKEFYVPTYSAFTTVTMDITGITSLERIRITALHNDEDYLVVSYMVAVKDELPLDIFQALKDGLEDVRTELYGSGKQIGTVTGSAAAKTITITGARDFLIPGAVIYISNGASSETHQINTMSEDDYTFTPRYDGISLVNSHTAKSVYIVYPIEYGVFENDATFPGVAIWGFTPEPVTTKSLKDEQIQSYDGTNFRVKQGGVVERWQIALDIQSKSPELIADMTRIIRTYLSRNVLWINGQKFDIMWREVPVDVAPQQAFDVISKLVYLVNVEIIEDNFAKKTLPVVTTNVLTYTIE